MSPDEFKQFCAAQVQRLGQFRQFEFMAQPAQRDYRKWLERKCQTPERAERLMDAVAELEQMPTIADMNRIFLELYPPSRTEPNLECERCKGAGWEIISRGGAEGAIRCPNGCPVPLVDSTQPIHTNGTAAQHKRMREETSAFAAELARDLAGSLMKPKVSRPTEAELLEEIERVKAEQEKHRKVKVAVENGSGSSGEPG